MERPTLIKNGPLLTALRDWMQLRGVRHEDLIEPWGLRLSSVSERLYGETRLSVAELLALLELLDLPAEELFRGLRAGFHAEPFLDKLEKEDKDPVRNLVRHHLQRPPAKAYSPEALRDMAAGLEALRFRDRKAARTRALEVLRSPDLDPEVAGEAWGVLGVLHRYEGKISCAAHCYGKALRVRGSDRLRARTWQRVAMLLLYNVGDTDLALEVTRWARASYLSGGDTVGIGKTLVDEGAILGYVGAYRRAIVAYMQALKLLGNEALEHRVAGFQGIGVASVYLGDIRSAVTHLDRALAALSGNKLSKVYASVLFLQGEISLLLGQLADAADYFVRVRNRFLDLEMLWEVTLVSLRIAKVHFLQGDRQCLRKILNEMLYSQEDVKRSNKVLGAVFADFLAECARGEISAALLEETYCKMREGAQAAPPPLPLRLPPSMR
jgi:tetratricopeptide (TPR) repeat protein